MAKPKTKNRKKTGSTADSRASRPTADKPSSKPAIRENRNTWLGIPRNRVPHLIIFVVITIGGSYLFMFITKNMGIQQYSYEIMDEHPHDTTAFTQGLLYKDGMLYESVGKYGRSDIREVEMKTGKILRSKPLAEEYFGEGLTYFKGKFYQLTWKENKCFVYDSEFNLVNEFEYEGEGWGLTNDKEHLIMSNGSSTLQFIDPDTFEVVRKLSVKHGRNRKQGLNELEYAGGKIFANDLNRPFIYEINPNTGVIESEIDLRSLVPRDVKVDVMNGIAFIPTTGHFLVTGKEWPTVYEIRRIPKEKARKKKK